MNGLPGWMRTALLLTAGMNGLVALSFLPGATAARSLAGLPPDAHPVYLLTVGLFVLLFGIGYLWTALANRPERLFIALAAAGKIAFFALLFALWATGALPARAPLLGTADLVFGALFVAWLVADARARRAA